MKTLTGPISCALCGTQYWNEYVYRVIDDGDEMQFVCDPCRIVLNNANRLHVKTSREEYEAAVSEYEFDIDRRHDGETI